MSMIVSNQIQIQMLKKINFYYAHSHIYMGIQKMIFTIKFIASELAS